jgi:hypothetical protein
MRPITTDPERQYRWLLYRREFQVRPSYLGQITAKDELEARRLGSEYFELPIMQILAIRSDLRAEEKEGPYDESDK